MRTVIEAEDEAGQGAVAALAQAVVVAVSEEVVEVAQSWRRSKCFIEAVNRFNR